MNGDADVFSQHMVAVAQKLWDKPNPHLCTPTELRWGTHGSKSVDLEKGVWSDHEAKEGGGVLDLVKRERRCSTGEALDWLREVIGADLEDRREQRPDHSARAKVVATYDYTDEAGALLFQVCRMEPKTFRQRRPDPAARDGWNWSVRGVRQVPYRLADVIEAVACGQTVFIAEGEKDVDALWRAGIPATCNAGGAGKWPEGLAEHFRGADVVILPDNDDAGRNHATIVGAALRGTARTVSVLHLPALPPKGDVSDWLAEGGDGIALHALVEKYARAWTPAPPASRFGAIQWADIDRVQIRQDWLVEDVMFGGDIGMTYGASGSGKSFLMVHMGICVARGLPFLGKATRKGSVLYQAGEGGKGLVKRLRAYRQEHHCDGEDVPFILLPARVDLFSADGDTEPFIEECLAWKATLPDPLALIVIDTFSTASPGANENASEDMSKLIRAGEAINKATGAALMWVHHKNAAGDRERGHTSLRANIDTALEVTKDQETKLRTAHLVKLKDGEDGLKLTFDLQSVTVGAYDDGKIITSCVVVPAQAETERTRHRRPLTPGQAKFLKTLDTAISQYGGVIPGHGVYGVPYAAFRDLYVTLHGQGREPGAIRTAISRDGDELWREDKIGREDQWLWITEKGELYL
jgi:hypothetical protein